MLTKDVVRIAALPSLIGKAASHGCVRMTHWDALKLATLVHPGTRVVFAE